MTAERTDAFRPVVIGAPRSGFALLASVLIRLTPLVPAKGDLRQVLINQAVLGLGEHISHAILGVLRAAGHGKGVLCNPNFRTLLGGPKWLVWPEGAAAEAHLERVQRRHEAAFRPLEGQAYSASFATMHAAIGAAFREDRVRDAGALLDATPPRLLRAGRDHNIVGYRGRFYLIPHMMGPVDLSQASSVTLETVWQSRHFGAAERELLLRESSEPPDAAAAHLAALSAAND